MTEKITGRVYLIGAGPGDPELITIRGRELLRRAGAVLYDHLSSLRLLDEVPAECELIDVGKKSGSHSMPQGEINEILAGCAAKHEIVVRLKGGDPFVFGRGGEEIEILRRYRIPYEIVPGVTSAVAAPAALGIPVTHRGSSYGFSVYTAHTRQSDLPDIDWSHSLEHETAVFLMVVASMKAVTERLLEHGHPADLPATVVESGTMPEGRRVTGTLSTICELARRHRIGSPAVLVVGRQAAVDVRCSYDQLSGCRIAVCGTASFVDRTAEQLRLRGAAVERLPVLKVQQLDLEEAEFDYIRQATWLVFTSSNGVQSFLSIMRRHRYDMRELGSVKIAAVGSGTARTLEQKDLYPDYVPRVYTVAALAEGLAGRLSGLERVALIRNREGSADLTRIFDHYAVEYRDFPVYAITPDRLTVENFVSRSDYFDYMVFGSSAGVRAFFECGGLCGTHCIPVSVGPVTAATLGRFSSGRIITASQHSTAGITDEIIRDWSCKN